MKVKEQVEEEEGARSELSEWRLSGGTGAEAVGYVLGSLLFTFLGVRPSTRTFTPNPPPSLRRERQPLSSGEIILRSH